MTLSLTLLATLFASATDSAPAVDARWVTNTIPAIAVACTWLLCGDQAGVCRASGAVLSR